MADLTRRYPEAGHRVQHGAFLAIMGHVERSTPRSWWVTSERDPQAQYLVLEAHGTCTCQDFARHGTLSPCKHQFGVQVVQRLERAEVDREQARVDHLDDIGDIDQPIDLELTPAAYELLDTLGEPCEMAAVPTVGTCTRIPMTEGARALYRELYGDDPDAA
jgi:hypothetical protein